MKTFDELFDDYWNFAKTKFDTTPHKSVHGLIREALELLSDLDLVPCKENDIKVCTEGIDVLFYLLYILNRCNFSQEFIKKCLSDKLEVLKERKWKQNSDGTFSHVKD